jgi:hypothetical protein
MAQLPKPFGINSEHTEATKTIKISWVTPADSAKVTGYDYQFITKKDAKVVTITEAIKKTTTVVTDGGNSTATLTFTDVKQYTELKTCLAQVSSQPTDTANDTASEWGTEVIWVAGPSLTIQIGSSSYTLSQASIGGGTGSIYKLPVSVENPMRVTYEDLKTFAEKMPGNPQLPTHYPNNTKIEGSLDISEFVVDTSKKLFSLDISINLSYDIFPGLKVEKLGLSLKRTDGSL